MQWTLKGARDITGGIGHTRKTGMSYGLPAVASCKTGARLTHKKNSVCAGCYGCHGSYGYPVVIDCQHKRFQAVKSIEMGEVQKTLWVEAMVYEINHENKKLDASLKNYFRWHDTGDLVSKTHLECIVEVAKKLPGINFWLPTKEWRLVEAARKEGLKIPKNLCIRYSSFFVDKETDFEGAKMPISNVHTKKPLGAACPTIEAHIGCAAVGCRKCWNKRVRKVSYKKH